MPPSSIAAEKVWPNLSAPGFTIPESLQDFGPYSQAVKANGFIFVSGQTAFDPATGKPIEGGAAAQTERIMQNLKAIVEAAGSSLDRAVRLGVFLKDMNDFTAMNEVYARYFPSSPPARTTVEVARLPRDFAVEIDLIALA